LVSLIDPAKVIRGGASDSEVHYIDLTILHPISWDNKIMKDEVFGPILPILNTKRWMRFSLKLRPRRVPGGTFIFSRDQKQSTVLWASCHLEAARWTKAIFICA
jgi:aldehyde dehydrogenase (NAD+)